MEQNVSYAHLYGLYAQVGEERAAQKEYEDGSRLQRGEEEEKECVGEPKDWDGDESKVNLLRHEHIARLDLHSRRLQILLGLY